MRIVVLLVVSLSVLGACADEPVAPGSGDPASDSLEVRCDGDGTRILTPVVQAQPDGVHVLIHNVSGGEVLTQWDGGGDGAAPGSSRQTLPIPPGDARFRCQPMTDDVDPGEPGGWGAFQVRAPAGWTSPELACSDGVVTGNLDYAPGSAGEPDPSADAQDRSDGSAVRQAGYETDDERTYVALDGTDAVAVFRYFSDGAGGWLLVEHSRCH